jgi:hypothetical protein
MVGALGGAEGKVSRGLCVRKDWCAHGKLNPGPCVRKHWVPRAKSSCPGPGVARVVPTRRLDRDNRKAALCGLKAQIRPVEVEAERGIKPERRVSGKDQHQFVERAHSCWQLRLFANVNAGCGNPAEAFGGEVTSCALDSTVQAIRRRVAVLEEDDLVRRPASQAW